MTTGYIIVLYDKTTINLLFNENFNKTLIN